MFQGVEDSLWSVLGRNEKSWGRSRDRRWNSWYQGSSFLRRSYMMDGPEQDIILRGTETRDLGRWLYSRGELGDKSRPTEQG
jgi:hypothetical protein